MKRKLLVLLVAVAVVAALAWIVRENLSVEQLVQQEQSLRGWIENHPWKAFAAALGVYSVVSLVPGTSGKSIILGWFYGFLQGIVIVDIGLTVAAYVMFALSRYVLREAIQARMGDMMQRIDRAIQRDGAFYLLTLRMMHVPYTLVNYCSGASSVRGTTFVWTTSVGLLPGTMLFVYVGTQLPTLRQLVEQGAESLVRPSVIAALIAMGALPLAMRSLVRWGIRRITGRKPSADLDGDEEDSDEGDPNGDPVDESRQHEDHSP